MSKSIKLKNDVYWSNTIHDLTNKEIGIWVDGKKLYRKLIAIELPNNIQTTFATGLSNVSVKNISGCVSKGTTSVPLNYYNSVYVGSAVHCYYDNGLLYVGCSFNGTGYIGYAIIEFTFN